VERKIQVHDNGRHVNWLNELEWIDGEIWANVWQTDCVARIDPETGRVKAWILLQGLKSSLLTDHPPHARHRMDVLNGIAYDKTNRRLFVTGKWWPRMFELELRRIDWPPEMDVANARQLCIK
jgi:glutamine cyclotransferase